MNCQAKHNSVNNGGQAGSTIELGAKRWYVSNQQRAWNSFTVIDLQICANHRLITPRHSSFESRADFRFTNTSQLNKIAYKIDKQRGKIWKKSFIDGCSETTQYLRFSFYEHTNYLHKIARRIDRRKTENKALLLTAQRQCNTWVSYCIILYNELLNIDAQRLIIAQREHNVRTEAANNTSLQAACCS